MLGWGSQGLQSRPAAHLRACRCHPHAANGAGVEQHKLQVQRGCGTIYDANNDVAHLRTGHLQSSSRCWWGPISSPNQLLQEWNEAVAAGANETLQKWKEAVAAGAGAVQHVITWCLQVQGEMQT